MPKIVSASEAKTRFGSIMNWAVESKDDVIVESHGEPKVAIVAFQEYERLVKLREDNRRREALARLEDLGGRIQARNLDLSREQADSLADRFTREVVGKMIRDDRIVYQADEEHAGSS